jgi:hypothetical protein
VTAGCDRAPVPSPLPEPTPRDRAGDDRAWRDTLAPSGPDEPGAEPDGRPEGGLDNASGDLGAIDAAPRQLGKYRIEGVLGEGGMSVVYLARDGALERQVALKVLHRHLSRDPEARARLTREARASARLRHPNIPEIHDFSGAEGGDAGRGFIVSEYVEGWSLAELLRRQAPALPEVGVALLLGVAEALGHAHREGVIHRDVKPENILVGRDGVVKLTDFGIAHVVGGEAMTMTGTLLGSPLHMAPEQIRGEREVDARVDVWGFGTVLFMAVTGGHLPFEGPNPHVAMRRILDGERGDVRRLSPQVDSALGGLVDRCLALDKEERAASMAEVAETMSAWLGARGIDDVVATVRGYVSDPEGFERALAPRVAERLRGLAERAPSPHAAIELLGRVLLLVPGDAGAEVALARHVRTLRSRRRGGVAAWLGLGLVLCAGLTLAVWRGGPDVRRAPHLVRPEAGTPSGPPAPSAGFMPRPAGPGAAGSAGSSGLAGPPDSPLAGGAAPMAGNPAASAGLTRPVAPGDEGAANTRGDTAEAAASAAVTAASVGADQRAPGEGAPPVRVGPGTGVGEATRAPPRARMVEARVTVYPPAVQVRVGGQLIAAGKPFRVAAGAVEAVLTHPGCPSCAPDVRMLEVRPDVAGQWSTHLVFRRGPEHALAPARLTLRCQDEGQWVAGPRGVRLACNEAHALPVLSERPRLLTLSAYDAGGELVATRQFTLRPGAAIEWDL